MQIKTPTKRRKTRPRHEKALIRLHSGCCVVCKRKVIFCRVVKKYRQLTKINSGRLSWRTPAGFTMQAPMATVGHKVSRWKGGEDALHNYQLECYRCNNDRNRDEMLEFKIHTACCRLCKVPTGKRTICKRCEFKIRLQFYLSCIAKANEVGIVDYVEAERLSIIVETQTGWANAKERNYRYNGNRTFKGIQHQLLELAKTLKLSQGDFFKETLANLSPENGSSKEGQKDDIT